MISFYLREAFKSIRRAKSSFFLSLTSMVIAMLLIIGTVITIQISADFQHDLKNNISINIFLKDNLTKEETTAIEKEIRRKNFVNNVTFIGKDEAAEKFIKETGEDFRRILDYNPLPASFSVTFKENYVDPDSLTKIIPTFSKLNGVDEVVFKQEYVKKILTYLSTFKKYLFIITAILFLISVYIVYSTVKLVTELRLEEMETMKLVGAKLSTIKIPIILNGILIGFIASLISIIIFFLYITYIDKYINLLKIFNLRNEYYFIGVILLGPFIGFLVSIFSLKKITLKV
ncbi:MAG: permease-like cell division protein FtsX [Ignavibacteriaceae bacterium]|nr:permease-like cell division protein FtsX [Ignavibacteriaceae bacterium]